MRRKLRQLRKLKLCATLPENGLIVGVGGVYGNVIRFQPPLVITKEQIDRAIGIFAEALAAISQPAHAGARA